MKKLSILFVSTFFALSLSAQEKDIWKGIQEAKRQKDTSRVVQLFKERHKIYGVDTSWTGRFNANNTIYSYFFKYSKLKKKDLKLVLNYMKEAVKHEPNNAFYTDTFASLHYRLGNTKEAIALQEKAVKLMPEHKELQVTLDKMKKSEKTW